MVVPPSWSSETAIAKLFVCFVVCKAIKNKLCWVARRKRNWDSDEVKWYLVPVRQVSRGGVCTAGAIGPPCISLFMLVFIVSASIELVRLLRLRPMHNRFTVAAEVSIGDVPVELAVAIRLI